MLHPAKRRVAAAAVLPVVLAACASAPEIPPSLYERLGGAPRVDLVAARTVDRAVADPRTRRGFEGVHLVTLKQGLAWQLCQVSGGVCAPGGEAMADAHNGLQITDAEFDALVTLLRQELDRAHVPPSAKNELLRQLAPARQGDVARAAPRG
ncbi:group I truncated hemoglobin [Aquincola agrisoli]